jgi:hypothetical protein
MFHPFKKAFGWIFLSIGFFMLIIAIQAIISFSSLVLHFTTPNPTNNTLLEQFVYILVVLPTAAVSAIAIAVGLIVFSFAFLIIGLILFVIGLILLIKGYHFNKQGNEIE